jgi:anti-anti-sigma regulatory factor
VTVVSLIGGPRHNHLRRGAGSVGLVAADAGGLVISLLEAELIDSGIKHVLFTADQRLQERERRLVLHVATASIVARMLDVTGLREHLPCASPLDEAMSLAARKSSVV